jgi:type II secretory pathway predicted ATPase ExeA
MSQRDTTKMDVQVYVYELGVPSEGQSKIVQAHLLDGKTELEPVVDRDLNAFSEFYRTKLNNTDLSPYERAAIKTYLHWKLHPPVK